MEIPLLLVRHSLPVLAQLIAALLIAPADAPSYCSVVPRSCKCCSLLVQLIVGYTAAEVCVESTRSSWGFVPEHSEHRMVDGLAAPAELALSKRVEVERKEGWDCKVVFEEKIDAA
jgi:hypothetical protein